MTDSIDGQESETLLVLLVQSGDRGAFERLLRRVYQPVRRYVSKLAGESMADDILQEVSFQIFRQLGQLREPAVFRAWMFRIATRVAFVHLKRAKRWREIENDRELIHSLATARPAARDEFDGEFLSLIECVSPASRAVLLLHYQQHLSLDETAAILDLPLGTVKSRLAYGINVIRKSIQEKNKT